MRCEDQNDLVSMLMHEEEIVSVMRAHLLLEQLLNQLVEKLLVKRCDGGEYLEKIEPSWNQLIWLAVALGLTKESAPVLKKLGNIRNMFAHNFDYKLTDKIVNELYDRMSQKDLKLMKEAYSKTNKKTGAVDKPDKLRNLGPKEKFVLIAIGQYSMLCVTLKQIEDL